MIISSFYPFFIQQEKPRPSQMLYLVSKGPMKKSRKWLALVRDCQINHIFKVLLQVQGWLPNGNH